MKTIGLAIIAVTMFGCASTSEPTAEIQMTEREVKKYWQVARDIPPKIKGWRNGIKGGCVEFSFVISEDGEAQDIEVVKLIPNRVYLKGSKSALKRTRWAPTENNKNRIPVRTSRLYKFNLIGPESVGIVDDCLNVTEPEFEGSIADLANVEAAQYEKYSELLEQGKMVKSARHKNNKYWNLDELIHSFYPTKERVNGIMGCAQFSLVIDENGHPQDIKVTKLVPSKGFYKYALHALKQSRWTPSKTNQARVPLLTTFQYNFWGKKKPTPIGCE